jgi:RNA polymerase sigma-70 factor (ECF subfamily)
MVAHSDPIEFAGLVQAADAGDPTAFARLFERALPALKAFIRVRAGQVLQARESVADLAQSVCREMLVDLRSFEYRGPKEFQSWLFLLATRKILQRQRFYAQQRRDVRREVTPDDEAETLVTALGGSPTPSQVASAREQADRIDRAIALLPEKQRDAVTMSRLMGLGYADIAAELGCTESAARGLVMRGLAALAGELERGESAS